MRKCSLNTTISNRRMSRANFLRYGESRGFFKIILCNKYNLREESCFVIGKDPNEL